MDERVEFIATMNVGHLTMTEACRRFGVSRKTGYKWRDRYLEFGVGGIEERSRAPRSHPHAVSNDIADQLLNARRTHPHWGARTILLFVARRGVEPLPAASTVTELFRRHGLLRARHRLPLPKAKGAPPQPDFSAPNRTWCADFKGQFLLGNRSWCYPLTITDGCSRFLLCCTGLSGTDSDPAQRIFQRCFLEYGLPDAILTDNGIPFASHAVGKLSRLSVWWVKLGIRLHRIVPGRPQQNGRHERMHRTLKQETTDVPAATFPSQQTRFDRFRHEFNHDRPHAALEGRSPVHLYRHASRKMPASVPSPDYPGHNAVRVVHHDGGIRFRGGYFFLSEALIGEPVGLEEFDDDRFLLRFGPLELAVLDYQAKPPRLIKLSQLPGAPTPPPVPLVA